MPVKKTQSGAVDKRTKEGKAIAARMAKARAAKGTSKPAKTNTVKSATASATRGITRSILGSLINSPSPTKSSPSSELSVTGNKKIGTLMKEFNKKFPYLRLKVCYSYARNAVAKGESISGIDITKTLASVRRADSGGGISISGNKKIKSLEKEFDTVFGLYCQVCYTTKDGHRYYTSGASDDETLAAFNAECEKNGCKKGEWK